MERTDTLGRSSFDITLLIVDVSLVLLVERLVSPGSAELPSSSLTGTSISRGGFEEFSTLNTGNDVSWLLICVKHIGNCANFIIELRPDGLLCRAKLITVLSAPRKQNSNHSSIVANGKSRKFCDFPRLTRRT
ncbi:unnamed protein product [Schistosoma margrebowiei]|uniref:Uncharacterized protein n=1 Tax=Schistosoma margrebowiei TaxID=48269 RepID=A0A3P8DF94_9TREM|nr:unnamed protein product [Schistosoma margrebowiei]